MASNVRVVCRIRPLNKKERARGGYSIVDYSNNYETICIERPATEQDSSHQNKHQFNFDKCFPPEVNQMDVFNVVAAPILEDVFKGYNGTLFVYGQTGSGKTHTMMGPDGGKGMEDPEMKGIVPRIVMTIFDAVEQADENLEFMVKVSFLEIYMEKIRDLLDVSKDNLRVREDKTKGVWVEGATEVYVACEDDVMDVLRVGQVHRSVAATNMNAESSRSHSIFIVNITQKNITTGSTKSGNLYLVDLAGSEKISKTGAVGQTLEEAKMINKSLTALGQVINALTDAKAKHVPYRDSKLTRLLQNSLGGNSRTTLCINASPSDYNYGETLSTLRFGQRAKSIQNKAKVNQERSVAELMALLAKAEKEIAILRAYIELLIKELTNVAPGHPIPPMPSTGSENEKSEEPGVKISLTSADAESGAGGVSEGESENLETLREELEEKLQNLQETMVNSEELQEELARAKRNEEEIQNQNKVLVTKVAELELQKEQFEYENNQKQIAIEEITSEKDILRTELTEMEKSVRSLQTKIADQEKVILSQEEKLLKSPARQKRTRGRSLLKQSAGDSSSTAGVVTSSQDDGDDQSESNELETKKPLSPAQAAAATTELAERNAELEVLIAELQKSNQALTAEKMTLEAAVSAVQYAKVAQDIEAEAVAPTAIDPSAVSVQEVITKYQKLEAQHRMLRQLTAQKFKEFDSLKSSLLRDLQDRVEKVIDLEVLLDEAREQYETVVMRSDVKANSQKKVVFLERSLEQLTQAHHKLATHNHRLRAECDVSQKKIEAKDKRVRQLEQQLENQQRQSKEQVAELQQEVRDMRAQLQAMATRNEALEVASSRAVNPHHARIAKPLRGGGGRTGKPGADPKQSKGFFGGLFGRRTSVTDKPAVVQDRNPSASAPNVAMQ